MGVGSDHVDIARRQRKWNHDKNEDTTPNLAGIRETAIWG